MVEIQNHAPQPEELALLAAPAPRYTSYPSVPQWTDPVAQDALAVAVARTEGPVAVYVHVPFCWTQCDYCGCNMVVSRRQAAGERYLAAIARQLEALPLGEARRPVRRIHLGGGTPTWLSPDQLRRLLALLHERFEPEAGAEQSVEVHPGVTSMEHLDVLAEAGFNRLSIGVQSVEPAVLEAIGRQQTLDEVRAIAKGARDRGMWGLNLDLVVGLPKQSSQTLARTLDFVRELAPDRLAIYSYAHVPWLRKNQQKIDASTLPGPVERMALAQQAHHALVDGGWRALGLDHYALPHDPLVQAADAGTLSRDFMGHTDRAAPLIGLGPSAISELGDRYVQQPSHLGTWYRAVEGDTPLPVVRAMTLTDEDGLRRDAIRTLMCQLELDLGALGARHGVKASDALSDTLRRLEPWAERGVVSLEGGRLRMNPAWRPLLKNIAACFDGRLGDDAPAWRIDPGRNT